MQIYFSLSGGRLSETVTFYYLTRCGVWSGTGILVLASFRCDLLPAEQGLSVLSKQFSRLCAVDSNGVPGENRVPKNMRRT